MKTDKNTDNQNTKRRSTFAILFYINRTKVRKDGMCQLLCKVSIDAEWEQIGPKVSVKPSIWNPDKGRADGRSENAVTVNSGILFRSPSCYISSCLSLVICHNFTFNWLLTSAMDSRLWSESLPEPSGERQVVLGLPESFRAAQNTTCYVRLNMNFPS